MTSRARECALLTLWFICSFVALAILVGFWFFLPGLPALSSSESVNSGVDAELVIVPERDVKIGESLKNVPVRPIYWPQASIPKGSLSSSEQFGERVAKAPIKAMSPITEDLLTEPK